ncbi:MAG: glycosyltransferase family 4 protein [Chlamydiia bacterium]|nr:glycosyltransferase family 4 protein [Chlamydiia bacterium]
MKKHRVTFLSRHLFTRGGLEKWTRRLAEGFARSGAEVTILTSDTPEKKSTSLPCHLESLKTRMPLRTLKLNQFDKQVKAWTEKRPADIVFGMDRTRSQTHIRAGNGVHAAYLEKRKEFENYTPFKQRLNPLNQTILHIEKTAFEDPELKVLFTNSHSVKEEILTHYNVSPDKIEVIHNGVEWHEMESDFMSWHTSKQTLCSSFCFDPSVFHFLFVGNGYERKGLSKLLSALATLKNRSFHLSVVGKDKNIGAYKKRAASLGLEKKVHFFGPQKHIRPFYQLADALIIPSYYDPFANVTVEALAMGVFVISSKHNGGSEVLTQESGRVIEDLLSIDSFTTSLEKALSRPKTKQSATTIRQSVRTLDISNQIETYINRSFAVL